MGMVWVAEYNHILEMSDIPENFVKSVLLNK